MSDFADHAARLRTQASKDTRPTVLIHLETEYPHNGVYEQFEEIARSLVRHFNISAMTGFTDLNLFPADKVILVSSNPTLIRQATRRGMCCVAFGLNANQVDSDFFNQSSALLRTPAAVRQFVTDYGFRHADSQSPNEAMPVQPAPLAFE